MADVTGVVLAAGAGTRAGGPKALRIENGRSWLVMATESLLQAGCARVVVVLGARASDARALLPRDPSGRRDSRVDVAVATRWEEGMSHALRVGLLAATGAAALITLVDLPDLPLAVYLRVLGAGQAPEDLRQATFGGRPGHPVLIGAHHFIAAADATTGDRGASDYLAAMAVELVECGDLAEGLDRDGPA